MARLPGIETRDQIVCHVDMDCFYAACERLREPSLQNEPVVVGMGYDDGATHGAVATASYEAREYGVESAMPIAEALEVLPRRATADDPATTGIYRSVDMEFYETVSSHVKTILNETAETVRIVSIDEAYLDLGNLPWAKATTFGQTLKQDIHDAAGVVASIGIAPNMTTAKLASDSDKPDGLVVVTPDQLDEFLTPMPVTDLHGVGPVTAETLHEMGLKTAGDIAATDGTTLIEELGDRGRELYAQARGKDTREVEPRGRPKSLSSESAFVTPTHDETEKREKIRALAGDVADRATAKGVLFKTVGIKVIQPPYDVNTRARSLSGHVNDTSLIESIALDLLDEFTEEQVRKLGVRISNLSFADRDQASLDEWETDSPTTPSEHRHQRHHRQPYQRQIDLTDFENP